MPNLEYVIHINPKGYRSIKISVLKDGKPHFMSSEKWKEDIANTVAPSVGVLLDEQWHISQQSTPDYDSYGMTLTEIKEEINE